MPRYLENWRIAIWCLIIMFFIPYQAKSQDNKWLFYELDDNITYNKVSADIEYSGYKSTTNAFINDTLISYEVGWRTDSTISITCSPKTKIVSSFLYKSAYKYDNEVSTETYLYYCRLYFSNLFNSFKEKYGNPTKILISEKPYTKENMRSINGNISDTINLSSLIKELCYFEIYWKNTNRNIRLSYYGGRGSLATIEKLYVNYNNEKIKQDEVESEILFNSIIENGGIIVFICVFLFLVFYIAKRIRRADEENYQQALAEIENENEERERKKELQRQKELQHEQLMRDYNNYLSNLKAKYGNCDKSIRLHSKTSDIPSEILVFGQSKYVVIENKEIPFSDILDCTLNDDVKETETVKTYRGNSSATTKTNTGSMIGRSVAGGLLFGGVGAIVGGSTAKKDTIIEHGTDTSIHNREIKHNYTVAITVKDISSPVIYINVGSDTALKDEIVSLMKVIISMK